MRARPSHSAKNDTSGPAQTFLEDDPRSGIAELPLLHRCAHRRLSDDAIRRDNDAFARRETIGFDDNGEAELSRANHGVCRVCGFAHAIARRRNAAARHELFREHLAALELRSRARRAEDAQAPRTKQIDDAAIERQFGTNDGEIDALAFGERGKRVDVAGGNRGEACDFCHPWIPGCAQHVADAGFAREFPGDRMLAAAASDHQNLHCVSDKY